MIPDRFARADSAAPEAADELRLGARELAIILGVWAFLAALVIAGRFLDPRVPGLTPAVTGAVVRLTLLEYAIWMLLTPAILWFATRLTEEDRHRFWRGLLALLVGLLVAIAVDAVIEMLREDLLRPPRRRRRPPPAGFGLFRFRGLGDLGFVDDLMVYFAVLFAGVARASIVRARVRRRETVRLREHASSLQVQLADARLGALRAQLDPHFLFNTLNAISAMVERDPRGVRRMISRLSELLRHSLEEDVDEIPLRRELQLLDRYLEIMRVRFGDRLRVQVDAPPETERAMVPNLILQPLLENAIKYGISSREDGGEVRVTARRDGDRLVLRVVDDGPGPAGHTAPPGAGVGLRNVRARLAEHYGAAQHFALGQRKDRSGAVAEISLPFTEDVTR